ncbi:glutamate racemase [Christiangramia forsetii]|uniref:Glutamate racemase n=2 Tax=Christiangramia forsetii TaxID=411153 RepID=A0LXV2_CHRFK|nr:glutamate racemase [Christiangramia forsetii]GGG35796.1 glutamate racemase [Christiangramia forsetii]CAL65197.1 glutamate racemase [Christiangramia forsetii KT0803]
MNDPRPIGIFDSGVGGTSIWKEIHRLLPLENTIYLSDSRNAPYGIKTQEKIIQLSIKNTEKLLKLDCKLIVVACNTATTNAIRILRSAYKTAIIGIEPAIKPAALKSANKAIGILATRGTLTSELFAQTSELYTRDINVIEVEGNGLVELIENGKKDADETKKLLLGLLDPMLKAKIDYLVLGCSHYPYLIPLLEEILPPEVKIIDSGEAVARQTKNILENNGLLNISKENTRTPEFYTNSDPQVLSDIIQAETYNYKVAEMDF